MQHAILFEEEVVVIRHVGVEIGARALNGEDAQQAGPGLTTGSELRSIAARRKNQSATTMRHAVPAGISSLRCNDLARTPGSWARRFSCAEFISVGTATRLHDVLAPMNSSYQKVPSGSQARVSVIATS